MICFCFNRTTLESHLSCLAEAEVTLLSLARRGAVRYEIYTPHEPTFGVASEGPNTTTTGRPKESSPTSNSIDMKCGFVGRIAQP